LFNLLIGITFRAPISKLLKMAAATTDSLEDGHAFFKNYP
jgi:hypothetical protein